MVKRRRVGRIMAEINITPFTDVILVLLIIFMVSTPLIFRSGIRVHLPQASTKQDITGTIYITVSQEGGVYLEPSKTGYSFPRDEDRFRKALQERFDGSPGSAVVINGDRDSRYNAVITALDLVKRTGFDKVVLTTEIRK